MNAKKITTTQTLMDERSHFKPFQYPWAYDAWLKHEQSHWLHTEVPMLDDVKDWKKNLTDSEKKFLTHIFRFFTQGDIDVAGAYVKNYLPNFPQPEVRMMLLGFAAREALHIAAYSHLIETLGLPETTYNEFLEYQAMKDKHDYVLDISNENSDKTSIATHIAVFSAFTEGMQLFSSFIMLLNFARHGKMKGMGQIVTWSIVDETQHTESMVKLFSLFVQGGMGLGMFTPEQQQLVSIIIDDVLSLVLSFAIAATGISLPVLLTSLYKKIEISKVKDQWQILAMSADHSVQAANQTINKGDNTLKFDYAEEILTTIAKNHGIKFANHQIIRLLVESSLSKLKQQKSESE